jgi:hypothetical protein
MTIDEHATHFAGKPVQDWEPEMAIADPGGTIYRISLSYEEADEGGRWTDKFSTFLSDPAAREITGIVVGTWDTTGASEQDVNEVVEALVVARDRLPNLRAIFLGDIISEECEISWIQQSDVSPLFDAYPALEHFCVRGAERLRLGSPRLAHLKSLVLQSGGLPAAVVREVAAAELPELEHLELWLGTEDYGADATIEDLEPILAGNVFPRLRYLGLRDSDIADVIAAAVARALVTERIKVLDLSLGTLSDVGAMDLLQSPAIRRLERLDIHHHYCSAEMVAQLKGLGIDVDAGESQEPDEFNGESWRYVAVGE